MRTDPIGIEGGINLFAYAQNNPIFHIDIWGLACKPIPVGDPFVNISEDPIRKWTTVHKDGYYEALGAWLAWQVLTRKPAPTPPFPYEVITVYWGEFLEYQAWYYICWDKCGNETSREFLGNLLTGKTQDWSIGRDKKTEYLF